MNSLLGSSIKCTVIVVTEAISDIIDLQHSFAAYPHHIGTSYGFAVLLLAPMYLRMVGKR